MLKKPYIYLTTEKSINYHLLNLEDASFLAFETIAKYGRKGKKEFTQSLKLLPIYSFVAMLMLEVSKLELSKEDEKDWGLEKEKNYNLLDVEKVRKEFDKHIEVFKKVRKEHNAINRFDLDSKYTTQVVKTLIKEGNHFLLVENRGAYSRAIWLARSDKFGNLIINVCNVFGKLENEEVLGLDTFVISRNVIIKILETISQEINKNNKEETK